MTLIGIQRRYTEIGRIRTGEKRAGKTKSGDDTTYPAKLETFRLTSGSLDAMKAAAERYGGSVAKWEDEYQVITESAQLDVMLPPSGGLAPYSLWYELWSGGGCQRRCDGAKAVVAERVVGKDDSVLVERACLCDPDQRDCKPTLRVGFFLPDVSGFGLWRLESKGYNAAAELPGMLDLVGQLSTDTRPLRAVLRLEQRTSKRQGKTRNYAVPVLDLPYSLAQLTNDDGDKVLLAGGEAPDAPQLTSSPRTPTGEAPAIPVADTTPPPGSDVASDEPPDDGVAAVDLDAVLVAPELTRWLAGTHAAMRQRIKPDQDEHTELRNLAVQVASMDVGASLNELTARQWHRVAVALRDLPVIEQPAVNEDAAGEGVVTEVVADPVAAPIEQPQQMTMGGPDGPTPGAVAPAPAAADPVSVADATSPPGDVTSPAPDTEPAAGGGQGTPATPPGPPSDDVLRARYAWGEKHGFDDEALDAAAIAAISVSPLEADAATWQAFELAVASGAVPPPEAEPPKPGTAAYKALPDGMARSKARQWWQQHAQQEA